MHSLRSRLRRLAVAPIRLYQRFLSPLKPPTCRFHPTCSAFAHEAILVHGILKGGLLGVWRILRCQPFAQGGHDPIPAPGRWRRSPSHAARPGERPGGHEPDESRDPAH